MKKLLIVLIAFLNLTATFAQDWETDFSIAKEIATKENKTIVMVFQGSDWCAPCIKLDREIWSTETFKNYATDHFVMLQVDFPKRKKNALSEIQVAANNQLAETYNKSGVFPFVVVLDNNGQVLGETSYKKTTPETYIDLINNFVQ